MQGWCGHNSHSVSMSHTESRKHPCTACFTSNWSQRQEMLWHLLYHQVSMSTEANSRTRYGALLYYLQWSLSTNWGLQLRTQLQKQKCSFKPGQLLLQYKQCAYKQIAW